MYENKSSLEAFLKDLKIKEVFDSHTTKLKTFRAELRGEKNNPWMPADSQSEYQKMYRDCVNPWPEIIINKHAQVLQIDNYNGPKEVWEAWISNEMQSKQDVLFTEAIRYGYSYLAVVPGVRRVVVDGSVVDKKVPVFMPMSPANTFAVYGNDPTANYPEFVIQELGKDYWQIIDREAIYKFKGTTEDITKLETVTPHGFNYCPVVRIENQWTPKNKEPESPVKKTIAKANMLTDANFALALAERFASFRQKYGTGITIPTDGQRAPRPHIDSILIEAKADAKFGTFDVADMNQIIAAINTHEEQLAILGEVPKYELGGAASTANMDSDTLNAQEQSYFRAAAGRQQSFGAGVNRALRIAAEILDVDVPANASVNWQDMSMKNIGQIADAASKLLPSGLPRRVMYGMIPGVDSARAEDYEREAKKYEKATNSMALAEADSKRLEVTTQRLALYRELKEEGIDDARALELSGLTPPE